jgi:hypothetical protein
VTLADFAPALQDQLLSVLADWCEQTGDLDPLERALATGDPRGGVDPVHAPLELCRRLDAVLSRQLPPDPCEHAPDCPHASCREAPTGD